METNTQPSSQVLSYSDEIIARDVPYEDYLSGQYGEHVEWIFGAVVAMSPVSLKHNRLTRFLHTLFAIYLELTDGGEVLGDPFVMRSSADFPARQPEIQVLLPDRLDYLQANQVAGPANLVVEVVSPESLHRDRGEKFGEYERGGVAEYWIIDQERQEALFYVRDDAGLFKNHPPTDGGYTSHVMPNLRLPVDLLWRDPLPGIIETQEMVTAMLNKQTGESG